MNVDDSSQNNNYDNEYLPSILPVEEEKYSNIKIIDQKPIKYQQSPFESRKNKRKNIKQIPIKQQNQNETNSEFNEDKSENLNKNSEKNIDINYIKKPYHSTNRDYKKLRTQPNIQPKINFKNNTNKINPPQEIGYNNNIIDYNQIPQHTLYQQNINLIPNNLKKPYCNTDSNRVQHRIQILQKNVDENNSKIYEDNNSNIENSLHNVSFTNKNIDTNTYKKNKKYFNKYEKISTQIDPNILKQFRLMKNMDSNRKIIELERQKERLSRENRKLSKSFNNFNKEREKFELEKKRFLESKNRVLNDTKKYEERLIKLEEELQNKYIKKKNQLQEIRNKLKAEQNNIEAERYNLTNTYQTRLTKLENDYKLNEDNQNYNNNLNIDKVKRDQEILRQKEQEISDLKNNYIKRENNLNLKENELKQKEIELQDKEYELNNKFQNLIQKEQNLMNEKSQYDNNTEENQNIYNKKSQELKNKEQQLLNKENQLMYRENELKNKENEIKNKENIINNQENELNNRENELINKQNELDDKQNEILTHQNEINDKENQLNLLNKEIQNKQKQIIELNNKYNRMLFNKSSHKIKKRDFQNMVSGPLNSPLESRPSITVKKIQKNLGVKKSNNIPNLNNNLMNINKVETFGPIKDSTMSKKNKDIKDNDDFPENNLNDINDNDNFPENNLNDINDNDNFPENNLNDLKDNDDFPENNLNDLKDNDNFPENNEDNNLMNNNNNKPPSEKQQFNDDENFYGENPNDMIQQTNKNNKNEEDDMFEEIGDDFEQYINNQNDSQQETNNDKSINKKEMNIPNDGDMKDKEEEQTNLDIFGENNNDLMGEQLPGNNMHQMNDNSNKQEPPNNNDLNQKQSEENFSLDLSSKNNNLPDFQENNYLNKQNLNHSNNSQGLKGSNNINQNNNLNNFESGEMNLNNLNYDEGVNKNNNSINANNNYDENKMENEKDTAIDQIMEELYIEEYNPSLGIAKNEHIKYLNSVIQCFAHIPDITDKIVNLHYDEHFENILPKLKLTKRYRNLLINLFFPEKVYNMNRVAYNSDSLINTLYELNPLFQNSENIEIKEFINFFILKLHDELNIKKNNNNDLNNENINKNMQIKNENDVLVDFLQNFTTKNNSIISKALYGISKYTFYCHQCQNSFYNFQCYSYLYFNLDKIIEYKQSKYHRNDVDINLNDCLDYYQKSETLRGDKGLFCPSCLEQTESTSIKNIYSTKNVLILILDRNIRNNFNECIFELKETINLRDYVQYKKEGEKSREKFFLGGLVNYIGDNYGNETYNAFIRMGKNNDWYCYDDENIYQTSFQDIKNNGYPIILFYHKLTQK